MAGDASANGYVHCGAEEVKAKGGAFLQLLRGYVQELCVC